jgi:hypothetical protein
MQPAIDDLTNFVVAAKAATYVGDAGPVASSRPRSHDLRYQAGDFTYRDSYFGGTDFLGQEVVHFRDNPIWAMNYYGRIIQDERISAAEAGAIIKESLAAMYREGRFLGGFEHETQDGSTYVDTSDGTVASFTGTEWIMRDNTRVYELVYHGGLIRD